MLDDVIPAGDPTSRAGYLRSLESQIGRRPESKEWSEEWVPLNVEQFRRTDQPDFDAKYIREASCSLQLRPPSV